MLGRQKKTNIKVLGKVLGFGSVVKTQHCLKGKVQKKCKTKIEKLKTLI